MTVRRTVAARVRAALLTLVLPLALAPIGASAASDVTLWVDALTSHTESNDGSADKPYRTIVDAVAALTGPATINVLPAVYEGSVELPDGVILQGVPAEDRQPAGPVAQPVAGCAAWSGVVRGTVRVRGDDVTVQGLTFVSGSPTGVVVDVLGSETDPVERLIVDCNVMEGSGANDGIWAVQTASVVRDLAIRRNVVRGMHGGVYVNPGAESVTLTDNLFDRMSTGAISFEAAGSVRIVGNTFRDGADGIWIHSANPQTQVRRNTFAGNTGEALDYDPVQPEPALDARQNWWGSASGPRNVAAAATGVEAGADPDPDAATGAIEEAQDEAARQVIDGNIAVDPWCREDGCPQAPLAVQGTITEAGAAVEGAVVTATWGEGSSAASAPASSAGQYLLEFSLPWDATGTLVTLTARKDDRTATRDVTVHPDQPTRPPEDFALQIAPGEEGSAEHSEISAKPRTVPADGASFATISVTVRTAGGELRTGNTDRVEIGTTFGTLSPGAWAAPGVWEARLSSRSLGQAEVFGFVNDRAVQGSVMVDFVIGPPSGDGSTIGASHARLVADGTTVSEITVTVRDDGGHVRSEGGDLVRLSLNTKADGTPNGTLGPVTDNGKGTYTAEYRSSTVTGTAVVSAHVREALVTDEVTLAQVATIELAPGEANALRSTLTADPPSAAPADGVTAVPVRVQLRDAHGNNRTRGESEPADVVTFTTDFVKPDGADEQPETAQAEYTVDADTDGVAVLHVTSDKTGHMTVRAAHDEVLVPNAAVVAFGDVPPPATRAQTQITVNKAQRLANGQSAATITLTAKDADGNPVPGEPVTLDVTGGPGRFAGGATSVPGTTGTSGTFTATLTSDTVGVTTVGGTVSTGTIGTDEAPAVVSVNFRELSSPATSTLTASSAEGTAGSGTSGTVNITFQAKDADGNTRADVEGETVRFETDRGTIASTSPATGTSGSVTATLTAPSSDDPGVATVTAYLNGDDDPVASTASVTFHPPAVATNTDIAKNRTYVAADGVRTATITLDLKDAAGEPFQRGSDIAEPVVEEPYVSVKDKRYVGDGRWEFEVYSQVLREDSPVTATVNGAPIGKSVLVTFEPPTSALRSTLTRVAGTGPVRANGTDLVTLRVQANNAAGAARRGGGDLVELTVTGIGPARTLVPTYVGNELTGATPGVYEVTLSSSVDGEATITGRINGEPIQASSTSPDSVEVEFSPVADASRSVVSVATASQAHNRLANGSDSTVIRAQLNTSSGDAMTAGGDTVRLTADLGTFADGTQVHQGQSGSSGRVDAPLTSDTPGQAVVKAFLVTDVDGDGTEELTEFGTSATVTFQPLASTQETLVTASPETVVANDTPTATVTVQAKDSSGADRTTGREAITLTHDGGLDVTLGTVTDQNGTYSATIRSKTAKTVTITAKIGTDTVDDDALVTFVAEGAAAQTTTEVLNDFVAANNANVAQVRIDVRNAEGDDQSAPGDTIALTAAPGVTASAPTYLGAGQYGFTVKSSIAAPTRVGVKVNGEDLPVDEWPTITFEPETAAATTTLATTPDTVLADSAELAEITVQARNAADVERRGTEDAVTLTVSGPAQFDNGHQTVVAKSLSDGRYRAYLRGTGEGSATVTGQVNGVDIAGGDPAGQVVVTVHGPTSAADSVMTADDDEVVVGGATVEIRVQPKTAEGQTRETGGDTVILTTDRGEFAEPLDGDSKKTLATYDPGSDRYEATLHSSNEAGIARITGTLTPAGSQTAGAIGQPAGGLEVEFEPGGPSAATSQVTATPETITADGTSTSEIFVQLKDVHDNNVTDSSDHTLTMVYGSGASRGPITNHNDGTYTATLTAAPEPGTVKIQAKVDTTAFFTDTATVVMEAATSKEHTTIDAVPATVQANGSDTSTITVQAMASETVARTIGGDTIVLTTDHGTFSDGSTSVQATDNDDGSYTATFVAPTLAGTATVRGTVNGQQMTHEAEIAVEASAPSEPQSVAAQDGDEQATVSWSAPEEDGGAAVSAYRLYQGTALIDTIPAHGTSAGYSYPVTGLTNGTAYTFAVEAVNSAGDSPRATATARPFGAPDAPAAPTLDRASGSITLAWDPVLDGNGRDITGYPVTATPPSGSAVTATAGVTPDTDGKVRHTFTTLQKGVDYDFTVAAANQGGKTSKLSPKVTARFAMKPAAPSALNATPGDGKVTLSWTAPDNGGEPISTYRVTATSSGDPVVHQTGSAGTTHEVADLANGTAYTFTVAATNDLGSSEESASKTATPVAPVPTGGGGGGGGGGGALAPSPSPSPTPTPTPTASPSPSPSPAPAPLPGPGPVRINGEDRASTAAAVSASHFDPGVGTVYVATSANFADALAGGPAAAHDGGPVLLVDRDGVPEPTSFELQRLRPGRVVVLGGTGAISELVAEQLDEFAPVQRMSGADRFATAAAVSRATFPERVAVVYIATGSGFADALSGGAAAARNRGPVLLVGGATVPEATAEELRRLSPRQIVVLGGTGAVPADVAAELAAYTDGGVERVSGADRYATSAAVAERMFPVAVDTVFVATGENFPDALSGVPAAAREKAPLLLVRPDGVPDAVAAQLQRLRPRRIVILGGSGAVSAETERALSRYTVE